MSKHSNKIDEFYATSPDTAKWLIDVLREKYDLKGKTALEPCVGGFVFPDTAPELKWTTNDLNCWVDRRPDTVCDFLEGDFERFDFIITNPPFGVANKLAHGFLKKSTELADVVAMIVPSSMGKLSSRIHKLLPPDYKLVFAERCPKQWFLLPDGTERPVRTHGIIWERVEGYKRPAPPKPVKDTRTPFFEFVEDGEFAVRVYGDGIGDMRPWDESCGKTWVRFNCAKRKQIVALKLLMSFPWRWLVGSCGDGRAPWDDSPGVIPTVSTSDILHWTNCIAVLEGRLDPLDGVDYDDALQTLQERYTVGFHLPEDVIRTDKFENSRGLRGSRDT